MTQSCGLVYVRERGGALRVRCSLNSWSVVPVTGDVLRVWFDDERVSVRVIERTLVGLDVVLLVERCESMN